MFRVIASSSEHELLFAQLAVVDVLADSKRVRGL